MGLSESEITARLAALRRQREVLDREIADLVLYLELGRRLGAAGMIPDPAPRPARPDDPREAAPAPSRPPSPDPGRVPDQAAVGRSDPAGDPVPGPRAAPPVRSSERPSAVLSEAWPEAHARTESEDDGPPGAIPPPVAFTDDAAGARRYGRAVVQAACRAIAQAGRGCGLPARFDAGDAFAAPPGDAPVVFGPFLSRPALAASLACIRRYVPTAFVAQSRAPAR